MSGATGKILRDVNGRLKRDVNGKLLLWNPATAPDAVPDYDMYRFLKAYNDFIFWNSDEWTVGNAHLLSNGNFYGTSGRITISYRPYRSVNSTHYVDGCRYDISDFDDVPLALTAKLYSPPWARYFPGGVETDLKSLVDVHFVYQLSNTVPGSWTLDRYTHKALPILATMSVQDIYDQGFSTFFIADMPDMSGYDYVWIGLELEWIKDGTLPLAWDWQAEDGNPHIYVSLVYARLVRI